MSDTVGFIDRLPHALVAAFRATLEEVADADLVLHVIDAVEPERERQMAAVRTVLDEVGADDVPMLEVYNKCDRARRRTSAGGCARSYPRRAVRVGADRRRQRRAVATMESRLALDTTRVTLVFDARSEDRAPASRSSIGSRASCSTRRPTDQISIEADLPRRLLRALQRRRGEHHVSVSGPRTRDAGRALALLLVGAVVSALRAEDVRAAGGRRTPHYPDFVMPVAPAGARHAGRRRAPHRRAGSGCRRATRAPPSAVSPRR